MAPIIKRVRLVKKYSFPKEKSQAFTLRSIKPDTASFGASETRGQPVSLFVYHQCDRKQRIYPPPDSGILSPHTSSGSAKQPPIKESSATVEWRFPAYPTIRWLPASFLGRYMKTPNPGHPPPARCIVSRIYSWRRRSRRRLNTSSWSYKFRSAICLSALASSICRRFHASLR